MGTEDRLGLELFRKKKKKKKESVDVSSSYFLFPLYLTFISVNIG